MIKNICVLDCGSTGSRLHFLKKDKFYYTYEIEYKLSPVQDIYKDKKKQLLFIKNLKKNILKYGNENTKLYIGITAGVRNLESDIKKEIVQLLRSLFESHNIKLTENIGIMTSMRESKLERLSVSYVINNCRKQFNIKTKDIYGHIGMGGGSIQISVNKDNLCNNISNIFIPISFKNKKCITLIDEYFKKNTFKKVNGIFYGIESLYYIILLNLGKSKLGKPLTVKYLLDNLKLNDNDTDTVNYKIKYIFYRLLQNIFDKKSIIVTLPHDVCSKNNECVWALGYFLDKMRLLC